MMQTTNKFSNSYGFQMNGGGVASPRQTTTTQFGHNINHNIVPEESHVDIECSIEEKIEENISRLGGYEKDVQPLPFRRQQSPPPLFKQISSNVKPAAADPLQVTAQIPAEQPNTAGFIELNMHNDSSADEAAGFGADVENENTNQNTLEDTPLS